MIRRRVGDPTEWCRNRRVVATHDPKDLRRLAGRHTNVAILEI